MSDVKATDNDNEDKEEKEGRRTRQAMRIPITTIETLREWLLPRSSRQSERLAPLTTPLKLQMCVRRQRHVASSRRS